MHPIKGSSWKLGGWIIDHLDAPFFSPTRKLDERETRNNGFRNLSDPYSKRLMII